MKQDYCCNRVPVFQIKKIPNKYRDDHHINKYAKGWGWGWGWGFKD